MIELHNYNKPVACSKCGGDMIFKGVGEYECSKCKNIEYDDYGKVRAYVEEHRGATTAQISEATGVSKKEIREMLREERLELTADSQPFLYCEMCHKPIRSGRFCLECERSNGLEIKRKKNISGVGMQDVSTASGEKRFRR